MSIYLSSSSSCYKHTSHPTQRRWASAHFSAMAGQDRHQRLSTPRRKACGHCAEAKVRCDHKSTCSRCAHRGLDCSYPGRGVDKSPEAHLGHGLVSSYAFDATTQRPVPALLSVGEGDAEAQPLLLTPASTTKSSNAGHGTTSPSSTGPVEAPIDRKYDLVCTVDVNKIRNRWLNTLIPTSEQRAKLYLPGTTAFIYRILKSYTAIAAEPIAHPPFVHSQQLQASLDASALTRCFGLAQICAAQAAGSEEWLQSLLKEEMSKVLDSVQSEDGFSLLASFQAYLLYCMILFFHFHAGHHSFLRQSVIELQEIACRSAAEGLVCKSELDSQRPAWSSWVLAEAKRRTLFTMYLFDNILCAEDGLPTFISKEVSGLPAPASKRLWEAVSETQFEIAYNSHLALWNSSGLSIDELWPMSPGLSIGEVAVARKRVDQWLQTVDEYGTMLFAITISTHGG